MHLNFLLVTLISFFYWNFNFQIILLIIYIIKERNKIIKNEIKAYFASPLRLNIYDCEINENKKTENNISKNNNSKKSSIFSLKDKDSSGRRLNAIFNKTDKNNYIGNITNEKLKFTGTKTETKFVNIQYPSNELKFEKIIHKNFIKLYLNYIKKGNFFINPFLSNCYLEIRTIKIILFLFFIANIFTFNSIIFIPKYISEIFYNKGKLSFKSHLFMSLFSFIFSLILSIILNKLLSSKYRIYKCIQSNKNKKEFKEKLQKEIKYMNIKIIIFFIINFIFILFYWLYCSIWCSIYKNSQKFLIINSIISILITILFLIFISLLQTIITYYKLSQKNYCINKIEYIIYFLIV